MLYKLVFWTEYGVPTKEGWMYFRKRCVRLTNSLSSIEARLNKLRSKFKDDDIDDTDDFLGKPTFDEVKIYENSSSDCGEFQLPNDHFRELRLIGVWKWDDTSFQKIGKEEEKNE